MNDAAFFASVRAGLFDGHLGTAQVDGMNAILAAWVQHGDCDDRKLAYLLATALHETAHTMQPIRERGPRAYFDKYEPGTRLGKLLGNTAKGDGYKFRGGGFVQLTGRLNFVRAGTALGLDLVKAPERAAEPEIAAAILVRGCLEGWFTGKCLGDYIAGHRAEFVAARRVVNGSDKAELIAGYARQFEAALVAGASVATSPADPAVHPTPPSGQIPQPSVPDGPAANYRPVLTLVIAGAIVALGLIVLFAR